MNEELLQLVYSKFTTDATFEEFKADFLADESLRQASYNKLETDAKYDDFLTDVGYSAPKKATADSTESPSDSAQELFSLDTSEEQETNTEVSESSQEETKEYPEVEITDRVGEIEPDVNLDVASLYDQYKEAGKITLPQQKLVEQQLTDEKSGKRGVWDSIDAYATGFLNTGMAIPMYKYHTEEELLYARAQKNKTDFLSALPEDKLAELNEYAVNRTVKLNNRDKNILAENKILEEKSRLMVKNLSHLKDTAERAQKEKGSIPQVIIEEYENLYNELSGIGRLYNDNVDLIEADQEDIGDFYEELDLLKRNYGGLDYYMEIARLSTLDMLAGIVEFGTSLSEYAPNTAVPGLVLPSFEVSYDARKANMEFRNEIARQRELLKPTMSVTEIESLADFGRWLAEQTATQLPTLTVLMASGGSVGLSVLGVSSAGQKMGELRDENFDNKKEAEELEERISKMKLQLKGEDENQITNLENQGSIKIPAEGEMTREDKLSLIKSAERELKYILGKDKYSDAEIFLAGIGNGLSEVLSERVSLGILSKGKRAITAAKNMGTDSQIRKGFGTYVKDNLIDAGQEGSAEFGNQVAQNLIDILYLDKKGVHVFDGAIDALASGGAMGAGMNAFPTVIGVGSRAFMNKANAEKVYTNAKAVERLLNELEANPDLSESAKGYIQEKIQTLTKENRQTLVDTFGNLEGMSEKDIAKLIELDKQANKILDEVKGVEASDLSNEMKAELKIANKISIDYVKEEKQRIIDGSKQKIQQGTEKAKEPIKESSTETIEEGVDAGTEGTTEVRGEVIKQPSVDVDGARVQQDINRTEGVIDGTADTGNGTLKGNSYVTNKGESFSIEMVDGINGKVDDFNKRKRKDRFNLAVRNENGIMIADVGFWKKEDGTWFANYVNVEKGHRRKGIATAMYDFARNNGIDIVPSTEQTESGKGFSDSLKNKKESITEQEFSKLDLSDEVGLNKAIETLDKWDKNLSDLGKETLGMNVPIVVAQAAVKAMKVAAKTAKLGADVISAGINAMKETEWYKSLTPADKRKVQRDFVRQIADAGKEVEVAESVVKPSEVAGSKTNVKSTVRKNTGQTDTSAKVVTTEKKALIDKLKAEAKGARKAYSTGRKSLAQAKNDLKKLIVDTVKGDLKKGEVSRLLAKINQVTDKNFDNVADATIEFIEDHIENRQARGRITGLKKQLPKKYKKTSKVPVNIKRLARQARVIDQRNLNKEELEQYETVLKDILDATKGVTQEGYSPVKEDKAYKTLEKLYQSAEAVANEKLNEEAELDVAELTEEEIEALSKDKQSKLRIALVGMVKLRKMRLKDVDKTDFTNKQIGWLTEMVTAPLDELGIPALKEFVRVADNIIENGDFSSAYSNIVSKIIAAKRANNFLDKLLNSKLGREAVRLVKDNAITSAKDMSLVMKQMFTGTKLASVFNLESGLASLSKQYETTKRKAILLEKRYEAFIKPLKQKYPKINKAESVIARGVYGNLIQGSTEKDFEINKARVEQTIKNQEGSYKTKEQAKLVKEIYDEVKDLKSQQEVLDYLRNKNDGNAEILDFWMKEFEDIKDDLRDNTEEVYGEMFTEVSENYLPIGTVRSESILEKEDLDRPAHMGGLPNPKQSPTTMSRVQSKNLPKDYNLNLDFDSVMFNKYEKSIYDINVAEATYDVRNFFNDPRIREALGVDNIKLITKSINRALAIQRNMIDRDRDHVGKAITKTTSLIKRIASIQALGAITAYPKQFFGVIANSAVRLGKDAPLLFASATDFAKHGTIEIVEQSLARRGQIEGGTRQAYERPSAAEKKAVNAYASEMSKSLNIKADWIRHKLFSSLRTGDTHAAKVTWLAYYKQYLKKNGYNISELDMSQEHLLMESDRVRRKAASYAQQNVEETQIATDESRESELYSKQSKTHVQVFKDIFLPYSRFVIQAKMRMLIDISNAYRASKAGDVETVQDSMASIMGTITEQVVFHGMNYFILKPGVATVAEFIRELITGEEEEEDIDWAFKRKQFKSRLVTDLVPFVIGQAAENTVIELANYLDYALSDSGSKFESQEEYERFLRKIGKSKYLYRYGDKDGIDLGFEGLGVYQGAMDIAGDLFDTSQYAFKKVATVEGFYGNDKNLYIRKDDKAFMQAMFVIELFTSLGLMEAETYRAMKREQRKVLKRAVKVTKN